MNFKQLVIAASAALLALGGFTVGRMTAPGRVGNANGASGNPLGSDAGSSSPAEITQSSSQRLTPSQAGVLKPITAAELQNEVAAWEAYGGFFNISSMRKIADVQDRLKVSDVASIAAAMCAVPMGQKGQQSLLFVMASYAESDPRGALNLALTIKDREIRQNILMNVISLVAAKDPSCALAVSDGVEDVQIKRQIRSMALMSMVHKDPQRALGLVRKAAEGDDSIFLFQVFSEWGNQDPEAAKAALNQLSGRNADHARMALIFSLTLTDPKAAWDYTLTLPPTSEGYQDAQVRVVQQWAKNDPKAALKAALSISDATVKGQATSCAIRNWAQSDFGGALKYAVSVEDSTVRADILRSLSNNSSGNRKELLGAVLDHMPPGDGFQQAVSSIFSGWAGDNPSEAVAAISQLPPGRVFSNAANQIASQWAHGAANKQEVVDWVRTLPEGEARSNSLSSAFNEWSASDPQAALKALSSLSLDDKKSAASALVSGWSRKTPEAALQWASSITDAGERTSIVQTAVSQWASTRPDAAARYVERLPESERSGPMQAVVNNWASKDTEAAAAWVERQPSGASKDAALGALTRKISQEDPEAALTWVAGISDTNQRLGQTENIARDWIRQDPATAKAWISTSKLPENLRTQLLK